MTAILTPGTGAPSRSPQHQGEVFPADSAAAAYCDGHHVRLYKLAAHGWIIRTTDPVGGPGTVLGCVEEREGRFELMQIGGGFRWTIFDTLLNAVMHLMTDRPLPVDERVLEVRVDASSLEDQQPTSEGGSDGTTASR